MLLKMCRCGKIIPQTMRQCKACEAKRNETQIEYNKRYRDEKAAAFYLSQEWRKARGAALVRHNYIDLYAYHVLKEIKTADMVHHITELSEDWGKRLDINNLIPLSDGSHKKIHALYDSDPATKAATQSLLRQLIADEVQQRQECMTKELAYRLDAEQRIGGWTYPGRGCR